MKVGVIGLNKFIKFSINCNDPITMALTINSNYISNSQLSNLSLRKGIPPEYGILNYSGTKFLEGKIKYVL